MSGVETAGASGCSNIYINFEEDGGTCWHISERVGNFAGLVPRSDSLSTGSGRWEGLLAASEDKNTALALSTPMTMRDLLHLMIQTHSCCIPRASSPGVATN